MEVLNTRPDQNDINKRDHQSTLLQPQPPPATASPPSASASPTHEFSFTISLNPHPPPKSKHTHNNNNNNSNHNSNTNNSLNNERIINNHHHNRGTVTPPPEPLTAIDLSPADDIFFHGHLLPLHLLSHLPVSPRSSTNSMDGFTLPTRDICKDHHNPIGNTSFHYHHRNTFSDFNLPVNNANQTRPKSKSFSIFGRPKSKTEPELNQNQHLENLGQDQEKNTNSKKKLKQEVAQLIKRYMKMVRPFMSFPKAKRSTTEFDRNRQPHSFSGNFLSSAKSSSLPVAGAKRGKLSAPASMRTSPANSGILASGTVSPAISTTSDSTMEELQAAIQAAIAHCKNSIAIEDKAGQA